MQKKERKLKVYTTYQKHYGLYNDSVCKTIPTIILQGEWLRSCGFQEEDQINVTVSDGQLFIRKIESVDSMDKCHSAMDKECTARGQQS